jgi:hypothetical protein
LGRTVIRRDYREAIRVTDILTSFDECYGAGAFGMVIGQKEQI